MLLPRYTLRTGLIVLTLVALLSLAGRAAVAGEPWGIGIAVASSSLLLLFAIQSLVYVLAMMIRPRNQEQPLATTHTEEAN